LVMARRGCGSKPARTIDGPKRHPRRAEFFALPKWAVLHAPSLHHSAPPSAMYPSETPSSGWEAKTLGAKRRISSSEIAAVPGTTFSAILMLVDLVSWFCEPQQRGEALGAAGVFSTFGFGRKSMLGNRLENLKRTARAKAASASMTNGGSALNGRLDRPDLEM
jgi:hypothetical protein